MKIAIYAQRKKAHAWHVGKIEIFVLAKELLRRGVGQGFCVVERLAWC